MPDGPKRRASHERSTDLTVRMFQVVGPAFLIGVLAISCGGDPANRDSQGSENEGGRDGHSGGGTGGEGAGGWGGAGGAGGDGGTARETHSVTSIEPERGPPGTQISIVGENFGVSQSKVEVHFANRKGQVVSVSPELIEAIVPLNAKSGTVSVHVDHGRGFERYDGPSFTVSDEGHVAVLERLEPNRLTAGVASNHVIVGHGFISGHMAKLDGNQVQSTFSSDQRLSIRLTAADLPKEGESSLVVVNQSGQSSNVLDLTILRPLDLLSSFALNDTTIELNFNAPVAFGTLTPLSFQLHPETLVTKFSPGEDSTQIVLTTEQLAPNMEYTITVSPSLSSLDASVGAVRERRAKFQSPPSSL